MNKRRKYALVLFLLIAGGLLGWWCWRPAPKTETAARSATNPILVAAPPSRQVAAPRVTPVSAESSAAADASPAGPGPPAPFTQVVVPDLDNTVAQAITLLQNKDIPGLMQALIAPDQWDEWRAEMLHHGQIQAVMPMMSEVRLRWMLTPDQLRQVMRQLDIPVDESLVESYTHNAIQDREQALLLADLQAVLGQPATLASDGVHARYELGSNGSNSVLFFQKINGRWYLEN